MLIQTIGGRYQISRLGGGGLALPSLLKILTQQPQCVVKQLKPQATSPLTGSETFIRHRSPSFVPVRGITIRFHDSLLRGKSRILFSAEFIKGCDLSQELTPENTWVKMMLFPARHLGNITVCPSAEGDSPRC